VARFTSRPQLTVADVAVTEGNRGRTPATFTVAVSRALSVDATVCVATLPVTARADQDFDALVACRPLPAGATSVDFVVQVRGDRAREPDETFAVVAVANAGIRLRDPVAIGTIRNDD
jgi:hypothetical protein